MITGSRITAFSAFALCLVVGACASWLLEAVFTDIPSDLPQPPVYSEFGSGIAACKGRSSEDTIQVPNNAKKSFKILSKPRPGYTEEARENNVQGTVILRVVFLASGNIGAIEPIKTLPNGLTEQAIEAAKQIRFEPKRENGSPMSVRKTVEYTFTIY